MIIVKVSKLQLRSIVGGAIGWVLRDVTRESYFEFKMTITFADRFRLKMSKRILKFEIPFKNSSNQRRQKLSDLN